MISNVYMAVGYDRLNAACDRTKSYLQFGCAVNWNRAGMMLFAIGRALTVTRCERCTASAQPRRQRWISWSTGGVGLGRVEPTGRDVSQRHTDNRYEPTLSRIINLINRRDMLDISASDLLSHLCKPKPSSQHNETTIFDTFSTKKICFWLLSI